MGTNQIRLERYKMMNLLLAINFLALFCVYMKIEKLEIKINKYSKKSLEYLETVSFNINTVYSILCDMDHDKKLNK